MAGLTKLQPPDLSSLHHLSAMLILETGQNLKEVRVPKPELFNKLHSLESPQEISTAHVSESTGMEGC